MTYNFFRQYYRLTLFLFLSSIFLQCKRDFEKPRWDTNLLAPFAHTELSITNIVRNGSVQTNPDNSIDLFIRDTLYSLRMDSLVKINTPGFDITKTLDSIVFSTPPITTTVTLGMIARQLIAQGNTTVGQLILDSHGQSTFVPPGFIQNITAGPIPINISDLLEEAEINEGFLDISITNGLPLSITNVEFQIANANPPGAVIAQPTLTNILPSTTVTHTEDISGQHVEGSLAGRILDMDFGGGFVTIDTNDAVTITLQVREVTVTSATAVFPEQNVIDDEAVNYLVDMGSVELKEVKIRSGFVRIEVSSTVPDTIFFNYQIPGAVKDGIPFETQTQVPPSGGVTIFTYDMSDYLISLRGKPGDDEHNALYNKLVGRIKYTGEKISLSLSDFMTVKISLEDVRPSYVRGYLGDSVIALNGSAPLNTFKNITGGSIAFESADPAVVIDNAFGADGAATINGIVAYRGASSVALSSPLLGSPVTIPKGLDGNPPTIITTPIHLGGGGSNAPALINLMPDRMDYDGQLEINPSHVVDHTQFAYADYPVNALVEFRLPLSLIADQLELADTIAISASPQMNTALKKGKLNLIIDNGFPLDAKVKTYFLDGSGTLMDSLASDQLIKRAPKGGDGKVTNKERTTIQYSLSAEKISNIQNASFVSFKVSFSSESGVYTKIYSDYKIKFKLAGDIQYTVNGQ